MCIRDRAGAFPGVGDGVRVRGGGYHRLHDVFVGSQRIAMKAEPGSSCVEGVYEMCDGAAGQRPPLRTLVQRKRGGHRPRHSPGEAPEGGLVREVIAGDLVPVPGAGVVDPALQLEVVRQVKQPPVVAADSMNFWISGQREQLVALLGKVHALLINDEEARQLAGEHNLRKAASAILGMGPSSVIIKRGDAGALLFHRDGTFAMPALVLDDVKDPTGAGDSFAGGFMGYLDTVAVVNAAEVRRAVVYGSAVRAFCCEGVGPSRADRRRRAPGC